MDELGIELEPISRTPDQAAVFADDTCLEITLDEAPRARVRRQLRLAFDPAWPRFLLGLQPWIA